ncbi:MAG TPA: LuxR C-terminal-related transcriptional regulator, partial [Polyangiaceae bacterium]|nr:LuxR C-terminal-related transcriptional regulator [Polyangiaceae bacterium]
PSVRASPRPAAARPAAARPAAGRVAPAPTAARAGSTLRSKVMTLVRLRAAPDRRSSVQLWSDFWTGNWFLVDHFDDDGRRFLVARRYGHGVRQGLSSRQWQVAQLVAEGLANKQIAHELGLAESTVATYLAQAMAKLGVRSRMELPRLMPLERRRGGR